jgi:LacI family transcriptional regulator
MVLEQRSGTTTKAAYEELAGQILLEKIDGVVCYQDYTAVGLIIELLTRRTRVPEDVAITGFDNLPIGNSFALGVTTYDYPALTIARQAIGLMESRRQDPDGPPIKLLVPGRLIVRESSNPSG